MMEALSSLFLKRFGQAAQAAEPLKGDGSNRKLWRLHGAGRSVIGAANSDKLENRAFVAFSRHFRGAGLPVPEIYAEDVAQGIYLEEDLGESNLFQRLDARRSPDGFAPDVKDVYRRVAKILPLFQIQAGKTLDYKFCYPRAAFRR